MKDSRLRIVVTGMVGLYPVGGVAWDYLQYAVGLHRLGHDVWYHEDTWAWPYDPEGRTYTDDGAGSANFLHRWFQRHEPALADRWHYQHLHDTHYGMTESEFDAVVESADLFLNVSGALAPSRPACRRSASPRSSTRTRGTTRSSTWSDPTGRPMSIVGVPWWTPTTST